MTESSTDQRRGSQLDDQKPACPCWCVGDHAAGGDFHRSSPTGSWLSELTVYAARPQVTVTLEAHIDEDGKTYPPTILLDGLTSEYDDAVVLSVGDAQRLVAAVAAAAGLLGGDQ